MDDLDRALIAALSNDGRAPLSKLADIGGVARHRADRLDRLMEEHGQNHRISTLRLKNMPDVRKVRAVTLIEAAGKIRHRSSG